MRVTIIGIDCAVDEKNVGVAIGEYSSGSCVITELPGRKQQETIAQMVSGFIKRSEKTLLALDAPLGWPDSLGKALIDHAAGSFIGVSSDKLFRRATDRFVKRVFGKQPLDVGADRIARTALAALELLESIRKFTVLEIPLAWEPDYPDRAAVIEVYPAGSLTAYGFPATGYKKKEQKGVRQDILKDLGNLIRFNAGVDVTVAEEDANVLDAIICVVAGCDFLAGNALSPSDASPPIAENDAKKEGWIWIKR